MERKDSPKGGVALVEVEEGFQITLWDHEQYAQPEDDPNAKTVIVSPDEVFDFFGR